MTHYCVQVTRTYEIIADDAERAKELALDMEERGAVDESPVVNVTDLDEARRIRRGDNSTPEGA